MVCGHYKSKIPIPCAFVYQISINTNDTNNHEQKCHAKLNPKFYLAGKIKAAGNSRFQIPSKIRMTITHI